MKAKFITFEGPEGCGKSTQSKLLYKYLKKKGFDVVYLREPGGTRISEKLREILLNPKNDAMSALCEMFLYMASRTQLVSEVIKPALLEGKIIICDRFQDSTLAYQGYGLGLDLDLIKNIGDSVCRGIKPDLTILLDMPVRDEVTCSGIDRDRIEQRPQAFHLRVRNGYLKLASFSPERIKIIKVDEDKTQTQKKIRQLVDNFLKIRSTFCG